MHPGSDRARGPRALEIGLVVVAVAGLVGVQLWITGSFGLFSRMFWLDEVYTHTLVSDPSLGHALQALAHGVETHPPGFYVALRLFTRIVGSSGETALRAFAFLSVLIALAGVYAVLRLTFPWWASAATLALLWAHPLVVTHAFDARFYGPWLAAVAWLAFGLARARNARVSFVAALAMAFCAAFISTVHYFGIVTLGLVLTGEVWSRRAAGLPLSPGVWPTAAGAVALAACAPFLIGQRAALSVATWQPSAHLHAALGFLDEVVFPRTLALLVLAAWLAVILSRGQQTKAGAPDPATQAGLTALLLLPVLLVAFSFMVQTALVPRYALPAVAGLAPPAAFLLARVPPSWALALGGCLAFVSTQDVRAQALAWQEEERYVNRLIADVRTRTGDGPVFFESPARLYVLSRYAPVLAPRCFLIDFEPGELGNTSPNRLFMRDLSRRFEQFYGSPRSTPWHEIKLLSSFFLVRSFIPGGPAGGSADYPGFRLEPVSGALFRVVRDTAPSP